jgi:hypothetical protein
LFSFSFSCSVSDSLVINNIFLSLFFSFSFLWFVNSWPNFRSLEQKAIHFLEAVLKDTLFARRKEGIKTSTRTTTATTSSSSSSAPPHQYDNYHDYKYSSHSQLPLSVARGIHDQYQEWIERMKIPPTIVKDSLDMDWPQDILPMKQLMAEDPQFLEDYHQRYPAPEVEPPPPHPPGPYMDSSLLSDYPKQEFERMVLEHFLVFDARFCKYHPEEEEEEERET